MQEEFNLVDEIRKIVKAAVREVIEGYVVEGKLDAEPLMTSKEVIDYFGISAPTLKEWREKGVLPYYEVGGKFRYKRHEITAIPQKFRLTNK